MKETVKLVVFVPETHADLVRKAMGDAGAGVTGDYGETKNKRLMQVI